MNALELYKILGDAIASGVIDSSHDVIVYNQNTGDFIEVRNVDYIFGDVHINIKE